MANKAPDPTERKRSSTRKNPLNAVTEPLSMSSAFSNGNVSFRMRRLEPFIGWAIAVATAWVNIFHADAGATPWIVALYAACIGAWSRMFPARRALSFLLRAVLLLCGAMLLQLAPGTGGPAGHYFFWTIAIVASYSLLLPAGWTSVLAVLALAAFAACSWLAVPGTPWLDAVVKAGLVGMFAPLAALFGRSLLLSDKQVELSLMDRRTQLYNEAGFMEHGAVLLDECRRNKRPFSMVLFNAADLRDVPGLLGRKHADKLFAQAVRGMVSASQGESLAARTGSTVFALVLPGMTAARASTLVQQKLGDPPSVQLDLPHGKVVIVLDTVISEATPTTLVLEDLYDALRAQLRERHDISSHEAASPQAAQSGVDRKVRGVSAPASRPRVASPTVPMPLAGTAA